MKLAVQTTQCQGWVSAASQLYHRLVCRLSDGNIGGGGHRAVRLKTSEGAKLDKLSN